MLKTVSTTSVKSMGGCFAILASKYNARYVDAMLRAAKAELVRAGADQVRVVRVPGAYEIPLVAAQLASSHKPALSAIICLGVIIRGETAHAQLIGESVTHALMQLQIDYRIPLVHEVLLLENEDQARRRCLDPNHNRGREAAQTAMAMAKVMRQIPGLNSPSGN